MSQKLSNRLWMMKAGAVACVCPKINCINFLFSSVCHSFFSTYNILSPFIANKKWITFPLASVILCRHADRHSAFFHSINCLNKAVQWLLLLYVYLNVHSALCVSFSSWILGRLDSKTRQHHCVQWSPLCFALCWSKNTITETRFPAYTTVKRSLWGYFLLRLSQLKR